MSQSTFREFSEKVRKAHYVSFPVPEAAITTRFIAERVAMKVAKFARLSAFGNSNAGDATYANDQFITTFYSCPLLTDATTKDKYVVMPGTPAGLPKGREIAQVSFTGYPNVWCVPMTNRADFVESGLPNMNDPGIQLFKVENGNIVFRNLPAIINSTVNVKLVGATLTGDLLLDQLLNVPEDIQDAIMLEILQELAMDYKVPIQTVETGEPS